MNLKNKVFFLILICTFLGCEEEVKVLPTVTESVHLKFTNIELAHPVYKPRDILLSHSNNLITIFDDANDGSFKVFSYPSFGFKFQYPEKDNLKNKLSFIDVSSSEVSNSTISYMDYPYYRKVEIDTLKNTFDHKEFIDLSSYNQEMNSVVRLNDTLFTARNNLDQQPESAHVLLSTKSKRITKYYGEYPDINLDFDRYDKKASFFRYRAVASREKQRIAVFYIKLNKLRIYDFKGNMLVDNDLGYYATPILQKDEVIYYESPVSIGDKIYVLYFNTNHTQANKNLESLRPEILEYDWHGNLISRFETNVPLSKITLDTKSNTMIGITYSDDMPVVKANLSNK